MLANAGANAPRDRPRPRYDEEQPRSVAPERRPERYPQRDQQRDSQFAPEFQANEEPEGERLNKRMAALGMASRREADEWIEKGLVRVNGKVARMGQRVAETDDISVSDEAKASQAERVTILLHKPIGWVSGQPEDGHPAAIELITSDSIDAKTEKVKPFKPWHLKSLAPCGRLDIDSTGLLVLSQDGRVARAIIGEDSDMEKEYLVRVEYQGAPEIGLRDAADAKDMPPTQGETVSAVKRNVKAVFPPEALEQLRHGLELDGQELLPAKVSWQNEEQLRFVLREGKKRQIRRMCELVGLKVVGLKRIRIGRVVLGDLPPGKWRYLQSWEKF